MIKKIKSKFQVHKIRRAQKREAKVQARYALYSLPTAYDEAILSWIAPETVKHERGKVWRIVAPLSGIGMIALALWQGSWSFALAIAAFILAYCVTSLEHPKDVEVKISKVGIKVGTRKYPYSRIKAFWVIYEPHLVETLNIRVAGEWVGDITIQLGKQNPSPVREVLMDYIPELEGATEKVSDIFIRLFKI